MGRVHFLSKQSKYSSKMISAIGEEHSLQLYSLEILILEMFEPGSDPLVRVEVLWPGSLQLRRQLLDLCGGDASEVSFLAATKRYFTHYKKVITRRNLWGQCHVGPMHRVCGAYCHLPHLLVKPRKTPRLFWKYLLCFLI